MPEVVFYQPHHWLASSLMASSEHWLTDLPALCGSNIPYLVVKARGSGGRVRNRGEQWYVYSLGQGVRAPQCHGENADHLKIVTETKQRAVAGNWMAHGRFPMKE